MALVELGRFAPPEAHMLVGRLEAEGIPAVAFDAGTSVLEGSLGFFIPTRVMVDEEDYAAAMAIRETI